MPGAQEGWLRVSGERPVRVEDGLANLVGEVSRDVDGCQIGHRRVKYVKLYG